MEERRCTEHLLSIDGDAGCRTMGTMNTILESRIGKLFIVVYALFAIATYVIAGFCGSETCGLYIVLPVMPWAYILTQDLGLSFPWAVYPLFVLINASVAYVFGAALEWLYNLYQDYREDAQAARKEHTSI